MELTLTPEIELQLAALVETGKYGSSEEIVERALAQLEADDKSSGWTAKGLQQQIEAAYAIDIEGSRSVVALEQLDERIKLSLDGADRGDTISGEEARARLASLRRKSR